MSGPGWAREHVLAALPADGSAVLEQRFVEGAGLRRRAATAVRAALMALCAGGEVVVERDGHGFTWARRGTR